ncbi:MAG TPA: hypothetical protein VGG71_16035 [Chitinophagaceae bacterium]|jgi:hypothetical protein
MNSKILFIAAGLILLFVKAGRTGLFAISCNNSLYIGGLGLSFAKPGDQCTTYWGIPTFPLAQQNTNYWNNLGVSAVSLPSSYGSTVISEEMRNYFFFTVIP